MLGEASARGGTQARNKQIRPFQIAFRVLSYVVETAKAGIALDQVCREPASPGYLT